jgi:hypothetical protein
LHRGGFTLHNIKPKQEPSKVTERMAYNPLKLGPDWLGLELLSSIRRRWSILCEQALRWTFGELWERQR